jgi:hypothetical protein
MGLTIEIDGDDPEKGGGERAHDLALDVTGTVGRELLEGEQSHENHGKRKAREGHADIGQPVPP